MKEENPGPLPVTYDFSEVEEIFDGAPEDYHNFLRQIVLDMQEAEDYLNACLEDYSEKRFRMLNHNLLSTVRVFRLKTLGEQFADGKKKIMAGDREGFRAIAEVLVPGVKGFREEVKRRLRQ